MGIFGNRHRTAYQPTTARAAQRPVATPVATPVARPQAGANGAAPANGGAPAQTVIARDGVTLTTQGNRANLTLDRPRVQGTASVGVQPGGATDVQVQASGTVRQTPVTAHVGVAVKPAGENTRVDVTAGGTAAVRGGVAVGATASYAKGQAEGGPTVQAEINVGPDVLNQVRNIAYSKTRQAIKNRQIPDMDVPQIAEQALGQLGKLNTNGALDGAVKVNMSDPALVEAVRQGVTQGIKDQPFRNRGLIRPEGMWRLRGAIAESRPAQRAIIRTASAGVERAEAQVTRMSNGVVQFENRPVARTGAAVTYQGPNFNMRVEGSVNDVSRWMRR